MTVSTAAVVTTHACNGVTVAFGTGFPFLASTELRVTRITIAGGLRTLLILGVDYSVTGAGDDAGGTVTTTVALAALYQLEIQRATVILQPANFINNDGDDAETKEDAFDRLTMIAQELAAQLAAVVAGGPGAITISNIAGAGAGWYSQQIANDYQFKKLNATSASAPSGLFLTDSASEISLRVGGPLEMVDPSTFPSEAFRLDVSANLGAFIPWTVSTTTDRKHWGWHAAALDSDGELALVPVLDDYSSPATAFLRFGRDNLGNMTKMALHGCPFVLASTGAYIDANGKRIGNVGTFDYDEIDKGDISGAVTFDFTVAQRYKCRATGNITPTFTAPNGPCTTEIEITQDGTGSRTFAFPAGSTKWTTATLAADKLVSTAAASRDLIVMRWTAALTNHLTQIFKGWQ